MKENRPLILEINKGAFNLILDSRSETDNEFLYGMKIQIFTVKSLILAQDER